MDTPQAFHEEDQYSWAQIGGIWLSVSAPMLLVYTALPDRVADLFGVAQPFGVFFVIIGGLMWQFVVGMGILRWELGTVRWAAIKDRTKLYEPRSPKTGRRRYALLWVGLLGAAVNFALGELAFPLDEVMTSALPDRLVIDRDDLFAEVGEGVWWVLPVFLWSSLFNYFLGEELIFRGVLLPKLQGVAGRFDWVLGGLLFGLYHLHLVASYPTILATSFTGMYLATRYRSNWMGIVVHGFEGVILILLVSLALSGVIEV